MGDKTCAGGQASRRTEVWRRGARRSGVGGVLGRVAAASLGGNGAEILMHVDRLCCCG